jgi:hypothetical protein
MSVFKEFSVDAAHASYGTQGVDSRDTIHLLFRYVKLTKKRLYNPQHVRRQDRLLAPGFLPRYTRSIPKQLVLACCIDTMLASRLGL